VSLTPSHLLEHLTTNASPGNRRVDSFITDQGNVTSNQDFSNAPADSPEANAGRATRLFCESGAASSGGEEVLHLPVLVEAAESSPAAAAAAAQQIRRFLGKEWNSKPQVQYNAIMLIRILSDNPGPTFTRNFDKGFVGAVKDMLRSNKDASTQQIVRETLDSLEANKAYDEGLQGLFQMWRKEKGQRGSLVDFRSRRQSPVGANGQGQMPPTMPGPQQQYQNVYGNAQLPPGEQLRARGGLPPPHELASRVEEAKNTAKILLQFIQSTPPEELLQNELIKEFSERCQSAQRSMQSYINCDNPAPDHNTLQTLIETNEQLSLAGSRHQRAVLAARRAIGATTSPNPQNQGNGLGFGYAPPGANNQSSWQNQRDPGHNTYMPTPPPNQNNGFGHVSQSPRPDSHVSYEAPSGPPPNLFRPSSQVSSLYQPEQRNNPFADPLEHNEGPEHANSGSRGSPHRTPMSGHRPLSSQAYSIDSEPLYTTTPTSAFAQDRRNTVELENAYSGHGLPVSPQPSPRLPPDTQSTAQDNNHFVSPQQSPRRSQQRPGPGPYHSSGVTPSYVNRQNSAVNGLTMHGA